MSEKDTEKMPVKDEKDASAEASDNTLAFCPCNPKCPNYGKCRECIEAHKKHYTAPFCIKKMQEEMKKNHIHPTNPHIKKTLKERVAEFYAEHPGEHLRTAAETLKITEWQLLDALDGAIEVPISDWEEIYGRLAELPSVLVHADCGAVVLQVETKLPPLLKMKNVALLKKEDGGWGMTSLIFPEGLYAAFLVRENLYGKESLSVALVGEDEKIAVSFYLRRNADGTVESESEKMFEEFSKKYSV